MTLYDDAEKVYMVCNTACIISTDQYNMHTNGRKENNLVHSITLTSLVCVPIMHPAVCFQLN